MNLESNREYTRSVRVEIARRIIQAYGWKRGKDRLFLISRTLLQIPRHVTVPIVDDAYLHLDLEDYLQRWMFCHKLTDEFDYYWLSKTLRSGDHFVDVGANIGIVSLLAARSVGENGRVYAIEALGETRDRLNSNIQLNDVSNIHVIPVALLDETKDVEFFPFRGGNIGGSSLASGKGSGEPVIVNGRTFDSLVHEGLIEKCDVMKMDIEGAEYMALMGMSELFRSSKPRAVLIEVSEELLTSFGKTPADILNFFNDHGYIWYSARQMGFELLNDQKITGFNNLWAFQPGVLSDDRIL